MMNEATPTVSRSVLSRGTGAALLISVGGLMLAATGCARPPTAPALHATAGLERAAVPTIVIEQASSILRFASMQFGTALTYEQVDRIDRFVLHAAGNRPEALHVSILAREGMPTPAIARVLVEAGVPRDNVLIRDGNGRLARNELLIVANLYGARAPTCGLVRGTADLDGSERLPELGCVNDAALAASIADPLDLIGRPARRDPVVRYGADDYGANDYGIVTAPEDDAYIK